MKIAIVGTGYVGLVTGTCFAKMGHTVYCVDINEEKIKKLQNGIIPIYEPGLSDLVKENIEKERLFFTTDLSTCINEVEVVFSAVGTPPNKDGSADLKYVIEVARTVGETVNHDIVLVTKSTVPVGTWKKVLWETRETLNRRGLDDVMVYVVSNPEFLKEGTAIEDFMKPERIVIGAENEYSLNIMKELYRPFILNGNKVIFMNNTSAELTKYAANSMLATRISFMNEIANLCEEVGANINDVRAGIASDSRIGSKFLYAGCGYGGSCFPKDVKALIKTGEQYGTSMTVINASDISNNRQKFILLVKLANKIVRSKLSYPETVCIWGLSFKPETDDMREATSVTMIKSLLNKENVKQIRVYDPKAMDECKRIFNEKDNNKIYYAKDMYDAAKDSEVQFLVTEWQEFRNPNIKTLKKLVKTPMLFDGRNIYNKEMFIKNGFYYEGIGYC